MEFFLKNPETKISIRELSRKLKVNPMTSKNYCDMFCNEGILLCEKIGRERLFCLKNKDAAVAAIKKAYLLMSLKECKLSEALKNRHYIFGSAANGNYSEKSDLDIFVIKTGDFDREKLRKCERALWLPINLVEVPFHKLNEFKKRNTEFMKEVTRGIEFEAVE
jgi:predicted nucleotidyltransferase